MSERSSVPLALPPPAAVPGGRLVAVDGRVLPLEHAAVRADAGGGLARVVLAQRFRNAHPEPLHVTYELPLPVDGAVTGFAFEIGARRVVGEVDRRAAARERFEDAILEGRPAALLEQERSSFFVQELGSVPAGAEVVAELTIDQRLRWLDEGSWEWRFPTVAAPRYLGAEGRVPDAPRVAVGVAGTPLAVRMTLGLRIRDPLAAAGAPGSPSHAIGVARRDDGLDVALDRDLVVRWPVAAPAVGLALDTGRPAIGRPHGDAAYGLLTLVPPAAVEPGRAFARDLIVLLDTSGSMSGRPLDQARAAATALVDSLDGRDRLELIAFADRPRRWRARPVAATAAARAAARSWLAGLEAGGGTEMGQGIAAALQPLRPDAQRQVVLVTDGLIGFETEIVAAVARDLPPGSRLHAVGVGSAVNRSLTAAAARAGRGAEVVVGLDEDVDAAVGRLIARTRAPLVTDLRLDGPALLAAAPARLPDLLAGGPALIGVMLRPEGGGLRARGRTPGGDWVATLEVPALEAGAGSPAVVALYGREAVEDLECRAAAGEAGVDAEIERLGLAFQIATRLTSWVAVSEEPAVDPTGPARRVRMPQALPDGLSVEGLGLRASTDAVVAFCRRIPSPAPMPPPGAALLRLHAVTSAGELAHEFAEPMPRYEGGRRRAPDTPVPLGGRLARRRGREVVIEITLDRPVDWRPARVEVIWADGTRRAATIDARRTTRRGRLAAGLLVRMVVRLDEEGPPGPPAAVAVTGETTPLEVTLTAP
jgi:Ca-activated chloride channel family protein